jgi:peptidoglycan/LPS O-acetylase OafA/YrhL
MSGGKRGTHLQHVPALDGLRGLAVAAVVAFHVGVLRGGWLGVDFFFVLSGYLISRLLFVEYTAKGRIDLRKFWGRRARRLLPALLCVIVAVAIAERARGRLVGPAGARWDMVGALTYTSNWLRLRGGAGYWSRFGPPSLLEHFWSLAIEEQFYLVWPLAMLGIARLRRGVSTLVLLASTLVAGGWSLLLFHRTLDASRVYMGTDSRAVALLAGATIASIAEWRPRWLRAFRALAPIGLVGLLVAMSRMQGTRLVTYQGGLLACTLAAAVLIAGVATGSTPFARHLSTQPLRWLGSRSYGIYLWHWPILVGFGVAGHANKPPLRIVLGVIASLVVAELSYHVVEMPIRRRGLAAFVWRPAVPAIGVGLAGAAIVIIAFPVATPRRVAAQAVTTTTLPSFVGPPSKPPASVSPTTTSAAAPEQPTSNLAIATTTTLTTTISTATTAAVPDPTAASTTTTVARLQRPIDRPARVLVVGDSVGWNLAEQLVKDQQTLGLVARNEAVAGCPPSYAPLKRRLDAGSVPLVFDQECIDAVDAYPALAADLKPDVTFVAFGASLLDQNEIAPGVWSRPCEAGFDDWYRSTLVKMSDALSSQGGRVVLVSQAYYRGEANEQTPTNDKQIDCENAVAGSVSQSSGGQILLADLGAWACPTTTCLHDRDGIELRPDGTHFKGDAAALANNWLLAQTLR